MNSLDALNSSLYFSAVGTASRKTQKNQEKSKTDGTKKSAFASKLQEAQEIENLANAGLPVEIAGMSIEEAVVFLQDAVDVSADRLSDSMTRENFDKFKKSVGQFLKYVQKNNYEIKKTKRFGKKHVKGVFFEETHPVDPYFQVHVIDTKLDELAAMLLQKHSEKLQFMGKVDEIKGLLVDFLAV